MSFEHEPNLESQTCPVPGCGASVQNLKKHLLRKTDTAHQAWQLCSCPSTSFSISVQYGDGIGSSTARFCDDQCRPCG